MKFWRATLDTRNFSFEAFGEDHDSAWGALVQGLARHGRTYQLPPEWFGEYLSEIEVREIALGTAYRGPELI